MAINTCWQQPFAAAELLKGSNSLTSLWLRDGWGANAHTSAHICSRNIFLGSSTLRAESFALLLKLSLKLSFCSHNTLAKPCAWQLKFACENFAATLQLARTIYSLSSQNSLVEPFALQLKSFAQ
jgi:hypothetical protein